MKLAEKIEDTMYEMALQMLNKTTEGALEIGKMADDIVDMESSKWVKILGKWQI